MTASGLPVGLELDGPLGSDRRLLSIGLAMEAVLDSVPAARALRASPAGKPLRPGPGALLKFAVLDTLEMAWPRLVAPASPRPAAEASTGPRILKKYPNRRLYDTEPAATSRWPT